MFLSFCNRSFERLALVTVVCSLMCFSTVVTAIAGESVVGFNYERLATSMPKALSDFTANKDARTNFVYFAGGCDAPDGNIYVNGNFQCMNISNSFFAFNPNNETFFELKPMPSARYRHAAVLIDKSLWVTGGRDVNDVIVPTVDVYNIDDNTWASYDDLPESYQLSDHGSFPNYETGHAYFCGGYTQNYSAVDTCYSINISATLQNGSTLTTVKRGSMMIRRGDISIVAQPDGAIVTSGFSDDNDWCEPYKGTEQYTFSTDTWTSLPDMYYARGDIALVNFNERIYAIGGERAVPNICQLIGSDNLPGPDQQRLTVDDIEMYNTTSRTWTVLEDLPSNRFRFSAIAFNDLHKIFAFGGQLSYNATCNCLATTSEVTIYTEKFASVSNNTISTNESDNSSGQSTIPPSSYSTSSASTTDLQFEYECIFGWNLLLLFFAAFYVL